MCRVNRSVGNVARRVCHHDGEGHHRPLYRHPRIPIQGVPPRLHLREQGGWHPGADLAGKRIGTPLYTQTAIWIEDDLGKIYARLIFRAFSGSRARWKNPRGHGDPPAPPPQLLEPVEIMPNTSDKSLSQMLAEGDIDAVLGSRMPDSVRTDPDRRLPVSEFQGGGKALLQGTPHPSDHAYGGDPQGCLRTT